MEYAERTVNTVKGWYGIEFEKHTIYRLIIPM